MKLGERDERILALLGTRRVSVSELASELDVPPAELAARLDELADNGLVTAHGDGEYERTESGRRVLVALPGGTGDERIDAPPDVERAVEERSLRADEVDAVLHVFALLRYWGRVTEEEIVDAVYSEAPAGRATPDEWWDGLVRDALAALPRVEPPEGEDGTWRYVGTPEVETEGFDGRRVLSRTHPVYGDVKHALESLELADAEREAARAAFRYLYRRGRATEQDVSETVFPAFPAGFESSREWWDSVVEGAFEAIPGVERTEEGAWEYRPRG